MSDDLDDLLRAAMKTLDDQVPSGYFEGLPNRTLARLSGEDSSMQTTGSSSDQLSKSTGAPPPERDEDSGLHDIRSMASSTKMRERGSAARICSYLSTIDGAMRREIEPTTQGRPAHAGAARDIPGDLPRDVGRGGPSPGR